MVMKTLQDKNKRTSNTGYKGISYTFNGNDRCYHATNRDKRQKKFYVNSQWTREQSFMRALDYVNN